MTFIRKSLFFFQGVYHFSITPTSFSLTEWLHSYGFLLHDDFTYDESQQAWVSHLWTPVICLINLQQPCGSGSPAWQRRPARLEHQPSCSSLTFVTPGKGCCFTCSSSLSPQVTVLLHNALLPFTFNTASFEPRMLCCNTQLKRENLNFKLFLEPLTATI